MSLRKALAKHTIQCMNINEVLSIVSEVTCPYCSQSLLSDNHNYFKCDLCLEWKCKSPITNYQCENICLMCNDPYIKFHLNGFMISSNYLDTSKIYTNYLIIKNSDMEKYGLEYGTLYKFRDLVFKLGCFAKYIPYFVNYTQ